MVDPHPHVDTGHQVPVAVVAVPAPVLPVDPDPLSHGNLPGKGDVPVAIFRVLMIDVLRLGKEHRDTLPCQRFCRGGAVLAFHGSRYPSGVILSAPGI
jgi:hypothetical protein